MSSARAEVIGELLAERLHQSTPFVLEDFLFPEQLDFVTDPERYATAVCSVRAGKTIACAADLIDTAIKCPGTTGLYVTLARSSAKRIIWPELKALNAAYGLNGDPNEADLSMHFPNGSWIYCFGAGDAVDIEKIRGLSNVALVYLDESQAFRSHIKDLIEDIIAKRLYDTNGRCRMIGTPGPVPAGYFYECSKSPKWSHHAWTLHQNPHILRKSGKTPAQLIKADCDRKGVTIDDPSIQRECFGRWVLDSNSLVFKYNAAKNHYEALPMLTDYVIAIDLGSNKEGRDKDAIAIIGWHKNFPVAYLVEEFIGGDSGITALGDQIDKLIKRYNPLKVIMDTGALGTKIADELRKRTSLPIQAAEKVRKNEFIELLNDALRTSKMMAKHSSAFAQDTMIIEWDGDRSTSDKLVMKDEPHSDICDAVLYGFRECLHWLPEPIKTPVNVKDPQQWVKHTQKLMEEQLQRQIDHETAMDHEADVFAIMEQDPFGEQNPLQFYLNKKKGR